MLLSVQALPLQSLPLLQMSEVQRLLVGIAVALGAYEAEDVTISVAVLLVLVSPRWWSTYELVVLAHLVMRVACCY